jgi:hypothetical protein
LGKNWRDVGIDPAQGQTRRHCDHHQDGDEDHLRQDDPEGRFLDWPVLVLQLAEEDGVDQPEQIQEGDGTGEEEDDHGQPRLGVEDGVVEDPAAAEAGQGRHAGDGDDADQDGDEGQRHQRDQAAHRYISAGAGALGDAAHREEQHRLVDVVVDDEHQGHQPAQVVHQRQAEHGVAHLADRGIGQQALGVLLEDRQQVADQGGQGADPEHRVGQARRRTSC